MTSSRLTFRANDLDDTDRFGGILAEWLPEGTTISLRGTLGAGKTRLVQAIAAAYGVDRGAVVSPTFVLCQHYRGTRTLHHLDAYRLKDEDEFLDLGVEELFASSGLIIVEWGERVATCLPDDRLEIAIHITGDSSREFEVRADADYWASRFETLQRQISNVPSA